MQLFLIEVLMHARRSDFMVEFKEAYKIANKFFLENDYACVNEAKETSDRWLFAPKCKKTCYGVSYVCAVSYTHLWFGCFINSCYSVALVHSAPG